MCVDQLCGRALSDPVAHSENLAFRRREPPVRKATLYARQGHVAVDPGRNHRAVGWVNDPVVRNLVVLGDSHPEPQATAIVARNVAQRRMCVGKRDRIPEFVAHAIERFLSRRRADGQRVVGNPERRQRVAVGRESVDLK